MLKLKLRKKILAMGLSLCFMNLCSGLLEQSKLLPGGSSSRIMQSNLQSASAMDKIDQIGLDGDDTTNKTLHGDLNTIFNVGYDNDRRQQILKEVTLGLSGFISKNFAVPDGAQQNLGSILLDVMGGNNSKLYSNYLTTINDDKDPIKTSSQKLLDMVREYEKYYKQLGQKFGADECSVRVKNGGIAGYKSAELERDPKSISLDDYICKYVLFEHTKKNGEQLKKDSNAIFATKDVIAKGFQGKPAPDPLTTAGITKDNIVPFVSQTVAINLLSMYLESVKLAEAMKKQGILDDDYKVNATEVKKYSSNLQTQSGMDSGFDDISTKFAEFGKCLKEARASILPFFSGLLFAVVKNLSNNGALTAKNDTLVTDVNDYNSLTSMLTLLYPANKTNQGYTNTNKALTTAYYEAKTKYAEAINGAGNINDLFNFRTKPITLNDFEGGTKFSDEPDQYLQDVGKKLLIPVTQAPLNALKPIQDFTELKTKVESALEHVFSVVSAKPDNAEVTPSKMHRDPFLLILGVLMKMLSADFSDILLPVDAGKALKDTLTSQDNYKSIPHDLKPEDLNKIEHLLRVCIPIECIYNLSKVVEDKGYDKLRLSTFGLSATLVGKTDGVDDISENDAPTLKTFVDNLKLAVETGNTALFTGSTFDEYTDNLTKDRPSINEIFKKVVIKDVTDFNTHATGDVEGVQVLKKFLTKNTSDLSYDQIKERLEGSLNKIVKAYQTDVADDEKVLIKELVKICKDYEAGASYTKGSREIVTAFRKALEDKDVVLEDAIEDYKIAVLNYMNIGDGSKSDVSKELLVFSHLSTAIYGLADRLDDTIGVAMRTLENTDGTETFNKKVTKISANDKYKSAEEEYNSERERLRGQIELFPLFNYNTKNKKVFVWFGNNKA